MNCRGIGLLLALPALLATLATAQAQRQDETPSEGFTFLHITDTHQTASGSIEPLRQLADEAARMSPKPAFIIDTGDITEAGRPEEYARFQEAISPLGAAGIKFYAVPGNHDVRWSPDGKAGFAQAFGKMYQSFDFGGAHFVLLDSTVALEHWGHLDKAQLEWLAKDLRRVRAETPILVFLHHWIGRDTPSTRPIDNEYDLWNILRGRNVVAVFTGHGHSDRMWKLNGITCVMARGLYQGSYHKVTVSPLLVTIERVTKERPGEVEKVATLPVAPKAKPSQLRAAWDDPDVPFLERRRPAAVLEPRAVTDNPDKERAEYRLNDGPWQPMKKDARDIWREQFPTDPIPAGVHTVEVRLTTSNNVTHQDELIFEVERDERDATRKWAINLDGPIQSSPLLSENLLYVSSLDGRVYALDIRNGKKKWTFATKGQFLASPVLAGTLLLIGGTDGFLYALDAATGRQKWKFDSGSPLFATAAAAQGVACVGGNGSIYGLDLATGKPRWTQAAGSFFQSRAATDDRNFYLGGWDNTLYALDVQTGAPKWKAPMGRAFYFSPAIASPCVIGGRVYVCSNDGTLHAVSAQTGETVWTAKAPQGSDTFGYSSPVVDGLSVYVGGLGPSGDVYALDTANGKLRWRAQIGQTIYDSSPKLAPDGKSLVIMGVRGRVAVLNAADGRRLWGYELGPGNIFSTAEYDGNIVYTTTMANDVQALVAPNPDAPIPGAPRPAARNEAVESRR